jgi:hypothetical protein
MVARGGRLTGGQREFAACPFQSGQMRLQFRRPQEIGLGFEPDFMTEVKLAAFEVERRVRGTGGDQRVKHARALASTSGWACSPRGSSTKNRSRDLMGQEISSRVGRNRGSRTINY